MKRLRLSHAPSKSNLRTKPTGNMTVDQVYGVVSVRHRSPCPVCIRCATVSFHLNGLGPSKTPKGKSVTTWVAAPHQPTNKPSTRRFFSCPGPSESLRVLGQRSRNKPARTDHLACSIMCSVESRLRSAEGDRLKLVLGTDVPHC
jgi:hypothetical protein